MLVHIAPVASLLGSMDFTVPDTVTIIEESAFGGLRKHGDILEKLSDGYTMDELQAQGISPQKIAGAFPKSGDAPAYYSFMDHALNFSSG